eukprot:TRINITY_DN23858_c0_g1_i1.p1 TRINITY_DN23858_c0_g1~~TRINITY_DN23858_c0_g1_i1.p1  ORF type:complete len:197 (-),score=58.50 TRINITY_DN23858_c0_g1_i1:351-941(-)
MAEFRGGRKSRQFRKKTYNLDEDDDSSAPPSSTDTSLDTSLSEPNISSTTNTSSSTPVDSTKNLSATSKNNIDKTAGVSDKTTPVKSMLSFGDEEEEVFEVKKTQASKNMSAQKQKKDRPLHRREVPAIVSTATSAHHSTGEYTPDKLRELRRNAMTLGANKSAAVASSSIIDTDISLILITQRVLVTRLLLLGLC